MASLRKPQRPPSQPGVQVVGVYINCHGGLMPRDLVHTPNGITISKKNRSGYGCPAYRGMVPGNIPLLDGPYHPDPTFRIGSMIAQGTYTLASHKDYLEGVRSMEEEEFRKNHPNLPEDQIPELLRNYMTITGFQDMSNSLGIGESFDSNDPMDTWRITTYSPDREFQTSRSFQIYVSKYRKIDLWSCTPSDFHAFLRPVTDEDNAVETRISIDLFDEESPTLTTVDLFDIFKILNRQDQDCNQFNIVDMACHWEEDKIRNSRPDEVKYGGKKRKTKRNRRTHIEKH